MDDDHRHPQAGSGPEDFGFPKDRPPYPIQLDFVRTLLQTLSLDGLPQSSSDPPPPTAASASAPHGEDNNRHKYRIGIFESPTGTGKSLSIICGSLTWLRRHWTHEIQMQQQSLPPQGEDSAGVICDSDAPDWIVEFARKRGREAIAQRIAEDGMRQELRRKRVRKSEKVHQSNKHKHLNSIVQQATKGSSSGSHNEDDDFLLEDYISDGDDNSTPTARKHNSNQASTASKNLSSSLGISTSLLDDLFSSSDSEDGDADTKHGVLIDGDKDEEPYITPKILYCSRTHSQLSQFVNELKRTLFVQEVRVVSLASRKGTCIHSQVSKIRSLQRINEVCLEMQRESSKSKRCPYRDPQSLLLFRDHVLMEPRDIEDLVSLGNRMSTCPYYGSRKALTSAHVVALPYASLIHRETRESLGIDLKNCVVIIDEAHNLIDAICNTYSLQLSASQVSAARFQLSSYFEKYQHRLHPKNQSRIKQLLSLLRHILSFLKFDDPPANKSTTCSNSEKSQSQNPQVRSVVADDPAISKESSQVSPAAANMMSINDFLFALRIDNINLFNVEEFIKKSELVKKLNGFAEHHQQEAASVVTEKEEEESEVHISSSGASAIQQIASFLLLLTNVDKDGQILVSHNSDRSRSFLKFVLLNPSVYFREIVDATCSVILTGGTMEPVSHILQQLFAHVPENDITVFRCGHVIPDKNLLPICLSKGPSGRELELNFDQRAVPQVMDELGRLVVNVCNVVPDGIVLFLPSYQYEETLYNHWLKTGLITQIQRKKKILREPKHSADVEAVLSEYKRVIDHSFPRKQQTAESMQFRGAVLSCVVGAKLSEGINFSDGYGRCVIVFGLPYPNRSDPELQAKINFFSHSSRTTTAEGSTRGSSSVSASNSADTTAGSSYYENLCMKAVNQSIGRSIRHANDYASILLVDKRYLRASIQRKLPEWIRRCVQSHTDFGTTMSSLVTFFRDKREMQQAIEAQRQAAV